MNDELLKQIFWGNTTLQYCLFAGIIIIGLLLKRIVSKALSRVLFGVFRKFAADVQMETFVALLLKPIEFFLSLTMLYLAINQLSHPFEIGIWRHTKTVDKAKVVETFTLGELLDKVFLFFIIMSIFWIILRIVDFIAHVWIHKATKDENRADGQLVPFLKELFKFIIVFIGFFVLLGYVFEVNALSLITGLGIGGIAIAMAAKESLENLIGSFTIFMDKPFTVGDIVKVDGIEGTIEKVGFRSTVLRSNDKTTVVIPNRSMIDGVLENLTRRNFRRVNFSIGLIYETLPDQIKAIVDELTVYLAQHTQASDPHVVFDGFAESALTIQISYLIENTDYAAFLKTKQDINFKVIEVVKKQGTDFAHATPKTTAKEAPAKTL